MLVAVAYFKRASFADMKRVSNRAMEGEMVYEAIRVSKMGVIVSQYSVIPTSSHLILVGVKSNNEPLIGQGYYSGGLGY